MVAAIADRFADLTSTMVETVVVYSANYGVRRFGDSRHRTRVFINVIQKAIAAGVCPHDDDEEKKREKVEKVYLRIRGDS